MDNLFEALIAFVLAILAPADTDTVEQADRIMGHGATVTEVPGQRGGTDRFVYEYGPDGINDLTYVCTNPTPGSITDGIAVRRGTGPTTMILTPEPGEVHACDPSIVRLPDGRWLLTYTSAASTAGENSVRAAVSPSPTGPFTRLPGTLVHRNEEPPGVASSGPGYRWGQSSVFLHPTRTPTEGDLVMLVTFATDTRPPGQYVLTLNSETLRRVDPITRVPTNGLNRPTHGGDVAYMPATGQVAFTFTDAVSPETPNFLATRLGVATKPLAEFLSGAGVWSIEGTFVPPAGQSKIHNEAFVHDARGWTDRFHLRFGAVDADWRTSPSGSWLYYRLMETEL